MPNPLNQTNIIAPRVPLIDERSGLISREWYRFFLNLFVLTGSGANDTSLLDLQVGPPTQPQLDYHNINPEPAGFAAYAAGSTQESQIAELQKQIEALALDNWCAATIANLAEVQKQIQDLQLLPPTPNQVLWSNVINQPKIEAYDLTSAIALTATPALLKPASVLPNNAGIEYDPATGVFTFAAAGSYSLSLSVNATSTAANQFVYIYSENSFDGVTWSVNANSGKTFELSNANTVQIVYPQSIGRVAGQKVRYWIYSNGVKVTLNTIALPGGVGVNVPAIRIQFS